jgi:transposase
MDSITHIEPRGIVVGIDTHKTFHVAAAKDAMGHDVAEGRFAASAKGYEELRLWAGELGSVEVFAIEGAGSYGKGLLRHLRAHGEAVLEVGRPNRQHRARQGKSDPADARAAAAAVFAGDALGEPKSSDGVVEMLRTLRLTRESAVRAKSAAVITLQSVLITAPDEVRDPLAGLSARRLVRACAALAEVTRPETPSDAAVSALGTLARRYEALEAEAKVLDVQIETLVRRCAADLLELPSVGPQIAAALLVTLGDNRSRITTERAFAKLCGVAPIDASSGRQVRHRLNRGGNRQANRALHTMVVLRLRRHQPTRDYMERRLAEGKTKKEVIRCLKRYAAREIFALLNQTELLVAA